MSAIDKGAWCPSLVQPANPATNTTIKENKLTLFIPILLRFQLFH
jgi:hypothetical protein